METERRRNGAEKNERVFTARLNNSVTKTRESAEYSFTLYTDQHMVIVMQYNV